MSAQSRQLARVAEKTADEYGIRYCTSCSLTRPKEGGTWIVYQNGLRRRWKCGACVKAALERTQRSKDGNDT